MLLGSAMGRLAIAEKDPDYKKAYKEMTKDIEQLKARGGQVENKNPHPSLIHFFHYWSRNLPQVKQKEEYVKSLYGQVSEYIGKVQTGLQNGKAVSDYFGDAGMFTGGQTRLYSENPLASQQMSSEDMARSQDDILRDREG